MVALKAEIEKSQQHLDEVIREQVEKARSSAYAAYQTALRQEQALETELSALKGEAIDQNSAAVEYTNLKVEIQTRRDLLDELMRKQSETEVAVRLQDTRESNVRIIDKALVPGGPFRPSLRKDVTYGAAARPAASASAARVLIEFLDRTVKTARGDRAAAGPADAGRDPRRHRRAGKAYGYPGTAMATATARSRGRSSRGPAGGGRPRAAGSRRRRAAPPPRRRSSWCPTSSRAR